MSVCLCEFVCIGMDVSVQGCVSVFISTEHNSRLDQMRESLHVSCVLCAVFFWKRAGASPQGADIWRQSVLNHEMDALNSKARSRADRNRLSWTQRRRCGCAQEIVCLTDVRQY